MPLWGNKDNAANSDIAAVIQHNKATTSANQSLLYGNTKAGTFFANMAVGQFAVDTNEMQANRKIPHSGWVLRKEGTGLRAGRVTYEVLVATGSIGTDNNSDDTQFPDALITITTQPLTSNGVGNLNLTVVATSTPSTTLTYTWQRNSGAGWVSVPNTAGVYFKNTSPTLIANATVATGNTFRVLVSATGANTVTSANAIVTTP